MGKRIVLAHLNIEVEDGDRRSDAEISSLLSDTILSAKHGNLRNMEIAVQLVETVAASDVGWENAGGKLA